MSFTDPIPRFSRLSLGNGVIMPISAKSHSGRKSISRPPSVISVTSITPPPSLRTKDSFVRSGSPSPRLAPIQIPTYSSVPSFPSTISSAGSLEAEIASLPTLPLHDLGVLSSAHDKKGIMLVRDNGRTSSGKDNDKTNNRFVHRITSLASITVSADDPVRRNHAAATQSEQKKATGGFRKMWNGFFASIRR